MPSITDIAAPMSTACKYQETSKSRAWIRLERTRDGRGPETANWLGAGGAVGNEHQCLKGSMSEGLLGGLKRHLEWGVGQE